MSSDFSVVAIVAAYNEADIIGHVVGDLIDQGVQVYFLDDGSTDRTVAVVERFVGRGVLAIEPLGDAAAGGAPRPFDWERILRRKTQLATTLDADWFIHHDADEFRESPWAGMPLKDAIRRVDRLGFNAIDFKGLDFWPVDDRFRSGDDVRDVFTSYAEPAPHDRVQIRCWKKSDGLDLVSSGGHEARFPGRRVFPLRFLLRHYPIRGQTHGERKVFHERRSRFVDGERARGWHVQYDEMREGMSFLRDPSTLTPYDPEAVRLELTLRPRGVEELEASLADARADADARRRDFEQCRDELDRTRCELGAVRAIVDEQAADLTRVRGDIAAKTDEAAGFREALDQRIEEIDRWRAAVDDQARRLDEFRRSRTWRWTSPARAVFRRLGGS